MSITIMPKLRVDAEQVWMKEHEGERIDRTLASTVVKWEEEHSEINGRIQALSLMVEIQRRQIAELQQLLKEVCDDTGCEVRD